jgi:hypothetical protein
LEVLNKGVRVLLHVTCQTVLPCLKALIVYVVDELVLYQFAELEVVPLLVLRVKNFHLVLYLKLEVLRELFE